MEVVVMMINSNFIFSYLVCAPESSCRWVWVGKWAVLVSHLATDVRDSLLCACDQGTWYIASDFTSKEDQ